MAEKNTMKNLLPILLISLVLLNCQEDEDLRPTPFTAKAELKADGWPFLKDYIHVTWGPSIDPEGGVVTYTLYLFDSVIVESTSATKYVFPLNDLALEMEYPGTVIARDKAGNETSTTFSFTTKKINTFRVTHKYIGYTVAHLLWESPQLPGEAAILYDVYLNNNLIVANSADTTILLKNDHPNILKEYQNILTVTAKNGSEFSVTSSTYFILKTDPRPLPEGLRLSVYNIGQNTANAFAFVYWDYQSPLNNLVWRIYLNDTFIGYQNCNGGAGLTTFPVLTGLTPNTTYRLKARVESAAYVYDPQYEQDPAPGPFIEKTFTTSDTPISNTFDQLQFTNITSTSVDFSWRILVAERQPCVVKKGDIRVYLNGLLWTTVDQTTTSATLLGLSSSTNYTLKIIYTQYDVGQIQKEISFSTL
jgi:hypothetical protein